MGLQQDPLPPTRIPFIDGAVAPVFSDEMRRISTGASTLRLMNRLNQQTARADRQLVEPTVANED